MAFSGIAQFNKNSAMSEYHTYQRRNCRSWLHTSQKVPQRPQPIKESFFMREITSLQLQIISITTAYTLILQRAIAKHKPDIRGIIKESLFGSLTGDDGTDMIEFFKMNDM